MRRISPVVVWVVIAAADACRSGGVALPPADAIVEGRTAVPIAIDTIADSTTMRVDRGRYTLRKNILDARDFWGNIAVLDLLSADVAAQTVEQLTFSLALKRLLSSDPDGAALAFRALHVNATDAALRARARVGLTMALSWRSDWPALAGIGTDRDSLQMVDSATAQSGVERWGHALSDVPVPRIDIPDSPVTLPLRRSAFGTPVVTVRINGIAREFWLDTGASMTLLSDDVAVQSGVKLAAPDTLALEVVAGHIPARAVFIDSLAIGAVVARGLGAALVNRGALRLDRRIVNGVQETVNIDGVIGTDILRYLDLVIDAGAGTITISRPRPNPRAVRNLYWVGYPVVRLVSEDGLSLLFGLDTGAEGTYVTTTFLRKRPGTPVAMRRGSIRGLGTEEHHTEWVARSIILSDGDHAMMMRNIPVAPERRWTFVNFDGVLGSDVALRTRMHLDFLNGVFEVRRSASCESVNGGQFSDRC
jgi:hypothetical protein